jgi:hypothetical protein
MKKCLFVLFMILTAFTIVFAAEAPPILNKSMSPEQAAALAKYLRPTVNFNAKDESSIVKLKKDF